MIWLDREQRGKDLEDLEEHSRTAVNLGFSVFPNTVRRPSRSQRGSIA